MEFGELPSLFRQAFSEWNHDRVPMLAAATAFYVLLSLTPLLILTIVALGYILGRQAVQSYLLNYAQSLGGPTLGSAIVAILQQISDPANSYNATIFGLVFMIFGSAGVFIQVRNALGIIWHENRGHSKSIRSTISYYIIAFLAMLALGILLLSSVVLTALVLPLVLALNIPLPLNLSWIRVVDFSGSLIAVSLVLMVVYRLLIDVRLDWKDVLLGSAITAFLFVVGNLLLEIYIRLSHAGSVYGAARTLFIFLLWLYYSTQIFFYGAEFIKVDVLRHRPYK